jgi:hypothetical protein
VQDGDEVVFRDRGYKGDVECFCGVAVADYADFYGHGGLKLKLRIFNLE